MALTPDQKKRIAALDSTSSKGESEEEPRSQSFSDNLKAQWFNVQTSALRDVMVKLLILVAVLGVAIYFIYANQLHLINYREALSSKEAGSPLQKLKQAVKLQRKAVTMIQKGNTLVLDGDYAGALATALSVEKMLPGNRDAQKLLRLATDAAVQRAIRDSDSGELEAALANTRLALKYQPDHEAANKLHMDIAGRLLHEAKAHFDKKDYKDTIARTREVLKINPTDMDAINLLRKTNDELLAQGGELFISKQYLKALEMVEMAREIDPKNRRMIELLKGISYKIERPELQLVFVGKSRDNIPFARIRLLNSGRVKTVKEGEVMKNLKVVKIDADTKEVMLLQTHTNRTFVIQQIEPE